MAEYDLTVVSDQGRTIVHARFRAPDDEAAAWYIADKFRGERVRSGIPLTPIGTHSNEVPQ